MKFKPALLALSIASVLAAGVVSAPVLAAGVRTITVETEGTGPSREKAITAALAEAVARVNGLALDTRDVSSMKMDVVNHNQKKGEESQSKTSAEVSEGIDRQTLIKTQGSVKSYQVLSVTCGEKGECSARISADINKFETDAQNNRRRIAVLNFREKGPQQDMFAGQVNQSMVDYLTGTRHFSVLDRDYQPERLTELQGLMRDDVETAERARIGNSLGADYIVAGTVEELHKTDSASKVPFTNEVVKSTEVKVVVSWRVIEAASGQVMVSNTIADERTVKSEDADQGFMGRTIGREIAETINDIIYPILVLSYEKDSKGRNLGRVVLGQGGATLKSGTEYRLVKYGRLHEDPYTGEPMGREELPVGLVRISQITPKLAYADVLSSDVDLTGAAPREYILRALPKEEQSSVRRKPTKTMTPNW